MVIIFSKISFVLVCLSLFLLGHQLYMCLLEYFMLSHRFLKSFIFHFVCLCMCISAYTHVVLVISVELSSHSLTLLILLKRPFKAFFISVTVFQIFGILFDSYIFHIFTEITHQILHFFLPFL